MSTERSLIHRWFFGDADASVVEGSVVTATKIGLGAVLAPIVFKAGTAIVSLINDPSGEKEVEKQARKLDSAIVKSQVKKAKLGDTSGPDVITRRVGSPHEQAQLETRLNGEFIV